MSETSNLLIEAGLSEEQSLTYEALLDKGPQRASNLSDWTGIKRGLTYKVLEQLENMGLIEKKGGKGSVAVFAAGHPSLLMGNIERREKELALAKDVLEHSLGTLSSKYNLIAGKPNMRFYEGKAGLKQVLDDTLTSTEVIYTYTDLEAIEKYIPDVNREYSALREKKGIQKRGFLLDTPHARKIIEDYHTNTTETKFIPYKTPEFGAIMQIYENKVSYITLKKESMIGIIIEDPTIYQMHRSLFEYFWSIVPTMNDAQVRQTTHQASDQKSIE